MYFLKLCKKRRSTHHFQKGFKVSKKVFDEILEYVRHTPSGYNAQPWEFWLINKTKQIKDLHPICYHQEHVLEAGALVVVLGDKEFGIRETQNILKKWNPFLPPEKRKDLESSLTQNREEWKKREMVIRNVSLAAMTFMYAAEEKNLATCPMMGFKQKELIKKLNIPDHYIPIMIIALGKADKNILPQTPPRKKPKDIGKVL